MPKNGLNPFSFRVFIQSWDHSLLTESSRIELVLIPFHSGYLFKVGSELEASEISKEMES